LPDPPEIVEAPRPGVAMPSTAAAPPAPPATGSSVSKPADSSVSVEVASAAQPRGGVLKLFSKRHRFVAPVPIRESQPALPRELRSHLTRETVDVKVYVDRTGKVDYAEVMSDGATSDLASFAIFSSRRWQFSPARVGDETVASEVVLRFRFNP
jgi:outer membrane biosynthesis protein TonB